MTINKIISTMTFKILIAVVLSATMIISFYIFLQDLHSFLGKFENGDLFQLAIFSLLLMATGVGLFYLLKSKKLAPSSELTDTSLAMLFSLNFKVLGLKFFEGFINGFLNETENKKEK